MNQIELESNVILAKFDVAAFRERFVIESVSTGSLLVIGGLFAITEWPHAAIACAIVATFEAWGAFRTFRRWRAAKRDLANAQKAIDLQARAEWIAMCELGVSRRFTPKDAA